MKNLLDNRLVTFLLSFSLAVVLWLYVQGELQVRKTLRVKVNYLRTEKLVAIGDRDRELKVDIRGPAAVITGLESEKNHQIDIDLRNRQVGKAYQGNLEFLVSRQFPREVELLRINPREIHFQIDRFAQKKVSLGVDLKGTPAEGFHVTTKELIPAKVIIGGGKSILSHVEEISIGTVDLTGVKENILMDQRIETEGQDYWIVGKNHVKGTIQIEEERIQKDFKVPIQLSESPFHFAISPKEIHLVVEGTYGAIQLLKTKDFLAYVDVRNLRAGFYRQPIAIQTPKGIKLINNSPRYFSIRLWKSKR